MNMKLYQTLSNHNTINKQKILINSFDITLKAQTNILNPIIKIYSENDLPTVDYAHIDELGRYYHIVNIEPFPNKIFILQLEVDVLETYKDDILQSSKVDYANRVDVDMKIIKSDYTPQPVKYVISTMGSIEGG